MHIVHNVDQWEAYADPGEAIGNESGPKSAGDEVPVPDSTSFERWGMGGERIYHVHLLVILKGTHKCVPASLVLLVLTVDIFVLVLVPLRRCLLSCLSIGCLAYSENETFNHR